MQSIAHLKNLPIYQKKAEIISNLLLSQVLVVSGETGSGKSSQLPFICYEAGLCKKGKIGVTQPRRIAATSLAAFVAEQSNTPLGTFVGYKVRFMDQESKDTKIKFMTDGILLRELQNDHFLSMYDLLIIDEAHERSLNIDFILGYLRTILTRRKDLRVIISSATINTELFSKSFANAPVITVSGRMFPVDIRYLEKATDTEEKDDEPTDYVSLATSTVEDIITKEPSGDILVFFPTEKDIVLAKDQLTDSVGNYCDILPLFGRMALTDQQSIFKSHSRQKIVLATNIAETSITVPNIRYVVDTGFARQKQYDPSMRITRLPIATVSQASAAQRAGRSGRVQDGVCIRLYSVEDMLSRPLFTAPEIQRTNLAQVILTMAALKLGKVDEFPFLEPPPSRAVSQGYSQLFELSAIDKEKRLTSLGKLMAELPIDPCLSRMIIEAKQQHCMHQVLVIAAGLSVQDVRLRPSEKKTEADAAHAKLSDPMSDFLFYLKLWDQVEEYQKRSVNQLKKYCKSNYLSFVRVREWQEVYEQLLRIVSGKTAIDKNNQATYEQIHRCIIAGFISHCAKKTKDGDYQVAKGRKAFLFPGSSLVKKKPDWLVCAELVETSRVFARTCASIDPLWLETIAPHLIVKNYSEPLFDEETGTVKATEKVLLFGLPIIESRPVFYGRINRSLATEIFIKEGLVAGLLKTHHRFLQHNLDMQKQVTSHEKKKRIVGEYDEATVQAFYQKRLEGVASIHDLNASIKEHGSDAFLWLKETDLVEEQDVSFHTSYPDSVTIGQVSFPIKYEFNPSSLHDGASITISSQDRLFLNDTVFDWLVPGFYNPRIRYLLECLPKSFKKSLEPIAQAAEEIASHLTYTGDDFIESMCNSLEVLYNTKLVSEDLSLQDLPHHLTIKVIVKKVHQENSTLSQNQKAWEKAALLFEKNNLVQWDFGDLKKQIEVIKAESGFSVYGFPALVEQADSVALKLFTSIEKQENNHNPGVKKLLLLSLEKELAWLDREMKFEKPLQILCTPFAKPEVFKQTLITIIAEHLFNDLDFDIWKKSEFEALQKSIKKEITHTGSICVSILNQVLRQYTEFQSIIKKKLTSCNTIHYKKIAELLKKELAGYIGKILDKRLNYNMFIQYERYFNAFKYKIERGFADANKFTVKYESIRSYIENSEKLLLNLSLLNVENQELIIEFAMTLEEYKISLFAQQEVKTLFPVSLKKVEEKWEEVRVLLR